MAKRTVTIINHRGEMLHGVLSIPDQDVSNKRLIIFFQVGIGTKTGVGDYLRIVADRLSSAGITVLRLDQSGTGDSQGELPDGISIPELFRKVQSGYFKEDSLAVIDWAAREFSGYQIYLLGECGGCISLTLAGAERMDLIDGVLMMAFPVLYSPQENTGKTSVREFDARVTMQGYLRKLMSPRSYARLLSGKSDWGLMLQSARVLMARLINDALKKCGFLRTGGHPDHERFNWEVFSAFQKLVKNGKPILFLLPQLDNETQEFDAELRDKVLLKSDIYAKYCRYAYLPETDHSIMFQNSRDLLCREILDWFNTLENSSHV
ncbi:MAG TPA: hypothetical protein PKZ42_15500 [Syntrophales bacterium]|nr:hypothetical protein [Syntrophales bacterium]